MTDRSDGNGGLIVTTYKKLILICLTLLIILTASGCGRGNTVTDGEGERTFTVNTAEAIREPAGKRLELSGELLPLRQVVVVPSIPGQVTQVKVQVGDRVSQGQLLVLMENTQQELQLRQAKIGVEAGRVEVAKLEHLVEQGAVAEQVLRGAKAELAQGEALLELAQYAYDVTFLKSPLTGVVGYIWAKEGELMGNTQAVLVMNVEKVLVQLTVDEGQLAYLAEGMPLSVEIPALGSVPRQAVVSTISPGTIPNTRSFLVLVEVDNPDGDLKPGMFARVIVEGESRFSVLVPGSALREEAGKAYLFVVSRNRVEQRLVETGMRQDGRVEILKGLNPGERYVVRVPSGLVDGSSIAEKEGE